VRSRRAGFSLIELLIVIAIIGVITTIAIPLLISTRKAALDEKARQSVRVVMAAQQAFMLKYSHYGAFSDLTLDAPPFLDSRFIDGGADLGNEIIVTVTTDGETFQVYASNPQGSHDYSGDDHYRIEEL
jgi:prepilin-type N-terminal cleavage/methylation domain-containing protein